MNSNQLYEQLQEVLDNRYKKLRRDAHKVDKARKNIALLPKLEGLPDTAEIDFDMWLDWNITIPWDEALAQKVLEQLQNQGWWNSSGTEMLSSGTKWYRVYNSESPFNIDLHLKADMDGSTCVITKIGTEKQMKEVPVYEVACPEGAAEGAFADD